MRFISQADIMLCKSDNSYTSIFLSNGDELVICKSLTKLAKEIDPELFIRVSQSYLINKNYISAIDKKKRSIELINKCQIQFTTTIKELLHLIGNKVA